MSQQVSPSTGVTALGISPPIAPPSPAPLKKSKPADRGVWDYLFMVKKRWLMITTVAALLFAAISAIILILPPSYRADVLVILQAPSVKTGANAVVLQPDIRQKLDALREQVESRRTLSEVIKKYDLFAQERGVKPQEEIFEEVRKAISLKLGKSSFNLYFDHEDPQVAANVANELARHYIEESTRLRRDSIQNTSRFINSQLERLDKEVREQEAVLKEFRRRWQGALPENVEANQALLTTLGQQVSQEEASVQGESIRKRQIEDRISEMITTEIDLREKLITRTNISLKRFPSLDDESEPSPARKEARPINTTADSRDKEKETPASPRGRESRTPFAETHSADEQLTDDENVEMTVLRESMKLKEGAVREADKDLQDKEGLLNRGLISQIVVDRARAEVERKRGELRIARAQALRTRSKYVEQIRTAESELFGLKEFQNQWSEMTVRTQELEAQRLRITSDATEETIRSASTRIEAVTSDLVEMRKRLLTLDIFKTRGELARQVQEHENIMTSLVRVQTDIQKKKERMAELERKLMSSIEVQVVLPELMRKHKTVVDQYENMLKQKAQAELEMGVENSQEGERMTIWDPAIPTSTPAKPKYALLFAGGFLGAISVATALALLLELLAPKFLNADTLQDHMALDVVAQIDELPRRDSNGPLPPSVPTTAGKVVALHNPRNRVAKQFIDCACMLFKPQSSWPRVVAVCSPGSGDGKTFVASNLAAAIAIGSREPTLLVDANLRAPNLHTLFGKPLDNGLSEALEGNPVSVHPLSGPMPCDLQLLTAGVAQRHGTVLLGSVRFQQMMEKLSYEGKKPRIILDTPPLKGGSDVDVLMDGVDGVLLVVRRGHTAMSDVNRILRRIPSNKLLGVIFNGNKPT